MTILQLGKFYPVRGGVEKVMRDLTEGLSSRGIRCDMLCATSDHPRIVQLNDSGRIICVKAWAKWAGTMIAPAMIRYLRKHRDEYDIVHIHHPDPMAALALRLSGFKGQVIVHWHSDLVSQKAFLRLYLPLQSWMLLRADTIVGTTPVYVRNSPYLSRFQSKCSSIPIGIRPIATDPGKASAIREKFPCPHLLLSVGRLVPYKGYSYLVDAMLYLPESYHLVIVGDGPLRTSLESHIRSAGLRDKISLEGYVEDGVLPDYFGACDVFVLPSIMKTEAFGIVQIEAMSCGKPVVATRIPESGVPWVNQDGISGVNVKPCDPQALAEGIRTVAENAAEYGIRAQQHFSHKYTLDSMIDKTLQLYENKKNL